MPPAAAVSLVWFFALGGIGIQMPLYGLYLEENAGLNGAQVGVVLASIPCVGMFSQPLWGLLADRTGSRARVLALIAAASACAHLALGAADGFGALLLGTAALACASTALIPSCTAVSLELCGSAAFARLRVWGTIGFGVWLLAFQPLLSAYQRARGLTAVETGPSEPGLALIFPAAAACTLLAACFSLALPRGGSPQRAQPGDWRELWRHRGFLRVVAFGFLSYLFLQGPLVMLPNLVAARGGSAADVSRIWLLMLSLEVPLLLLSGAGFGRVGARGLLAIGMLAGGVRFGLCGAGSGLGYLHATAPLHGVTVAGLQIGLALYVEASVPERLRSTAQNAVAAYGLGLGGMLSSLLTGVAFQHWGEGSPYLLGGAGALALAFAVPLLVPAASRPPDAGAPPPAR